MIGQDIEHGIVKWFEDPKFCQLCNEQQEVIRGNSNPIKWFRWGMNANGLIKWRSSQTAKEEEEDLQPDGWLDISDLHW